MDALSKLPWPLSIRPIRPLGAEHAWHLTEIEEAHELLLTTVAKLSGRVKGSLRGDKPLEQFSSAMQQHLDEVVHHCAQVAANHGATLEECAAKNVRKLAGRFERGTVRGDGDKR